MQTLGRVAIIGGSVLVALINLYLFSGVENLPQRRIAEIYQQVYLMALVIPAVSVLGVVAASILRVREKRRLLRQGMTAAQVASRARPVVRGRRGPIGGFWAAVSRL